MFARRGQNRANAKGARTSTASGTAMISQAPPAANETAISAYHEYDGDRLPT